MHPKTITYAIGLAAIVIVSLAALLMCTSARAGDGYYSSGSRATDRAHCNQFGIDAACGYKPRRHIRHLQREARERRWERWHGYRRPEVRGWKYRSSDSSKGDDGGFCSAEVSAVGTEHYSEEDAKKAAVKAWMAEVRHRRGTEFMDISVAEDVKFRCVTSTPGDRISDKVAAWTRGDLLKECRVMATPCKPPIEEGLPKGLIRDR